MNIESSSWNSDLWETPMLFEMGNLCFWDFSQSLLLLPQPQALSTFGATSHDEVFLDRLFGFGFLKTRWNISPINFIKFNYKFYESFSEDYLSLWDGLTKSIVFLKTSKRLPHVVQQIHHIDVMTIPLYFWNVNFWFLDPWKAHVVEIRVNYGLWLNLYSPSRMLLIFQKYRDIIITSTWDH